MNLQDMLNAMRRSGWRVGAHNDFMWDKKKKWGVFWMFTHPETQQYVEAEAITDYAAVRSCMTQANIGV